MDPICLGALTCPVCEASLARSGGALSCERKHSFDVAKEGYVNLLAGRKLPPLAGDSREMLLARRRFLERGHYSSLSSFLAARVVTATEGASPAPVIADVGCGEGHYLATVSDALRASGKRCCLFGTDIARDAARLAARRVPEALMLVADTHHRLPFATGAVHVLLNVFAARNAAEFARVLRPGGRLLIAFPNEAHLGELRDRLPLLGIAPQKDEKLKAQLEGDFTLVEEESLQTSLRLTAGELRDLVLMTPSARHLEERELAALGSLESLEVTCSFRIMQFARK